MFKDLGNIAAVLKHAGELQNRYGQLKESLGKVRVQGSAGGGMVTVEATGHQQILAVKMDESLLTSGDREMIEDLIVSATNQALEKARNAATEEMGKVAGDLEIPGLNDLISKMSSGGLSP